MEVTVGFSRSERSRNNLERNSNCSGRIFYGRDLYYLLLFPVPGAHNPQTLSASSWLQDPTLPRKLAVCPSVPGRWLHSTHARPLAACPFPKCSASSCLEGESELFIE